MTKEYKTNLEKLVCKESMLKNGICMFASKPCNNYPKCYVKITEKEYELYRAMHIRLCPICNSEITIHHDSTKRIIYHCDKCHTSTYPNQQIHYSHRQKKNNIYENLAI